MTDINGCTQSRQWSGSWHLICGKRETVWMSPWSPLSSIPIGYHVNSPPWPSPRVPPHLPDARPVRRWKVGRCLGEQRGASGSDFWEVKHWPSRGGWAGRGGTIWLVSRAGDGLVNRPAVSPNQLHSWAMTDRHAYLRQPQSAFRVFTYRPPQIHNPCSLDLLHFWYKVNDSDNKSDKKRARVKHVSTSKATTNNAAFDKFAACLWSELMYAPLERCVL